MAQKRLTHNITRGDILKFTLSGKDVRISIFFMGQGVSDNENCVNSDELFEKVSGLAKKAKDNVNFTLTTDSDLSRFIVQPTDCSVPGKKLAVIVKASVSAVKAL